MQNEGRGTPLQTFKIKLTERCLSCDGSKIILQDHCDSVVHLGSVVCFLLGNVPASGFYMPTFRNTLYVPSS